ncbi:MAG: hypothetical protein WCW66_03850 [Patescibacteria group bacterium]|jgi:hypothetical protein
MPRKTPAKLNEILTAANASRRPEAVDATTKLRAFMERRDLIGSDDTERRVYVPKDLVEIVEYPWRELPSAKA